MKRTKNFLLLFILPLLFAACQKTDDGSYVAPITIYQKMAGTWKIITIIQTDEIAKANSLKPDATDLKSHFGFANFNITFNVDADSLPTTFEVTGGAPNLFLPGGYWDLDIPFTHTDGTPVQIFLYSDASKSQMADVLYITSLPSASARPSCEIKLTRLSDGTPYVSYLYKLVHVQ
jgi:hypothetical protein